jgi:hypothetical protein
MAEIDRDDAVAPHDVHDRAGPLATITQQPWRSQPAASQPKARMAHAASSTAT